MSTEEVSLPIDASYWVIPGRLRAGEYPGLMGEINARRKLRWLLEQKFNVIIDLTKEGEPGLIPYVQLLEEEAAKISCHAVHKRLPLQDFATPPREQVAEILDTLELALSLGRNIYMHCHEGKGRTGTVVGCYLVRHGSTGEDALATLKNLRRGISGSSINSPETEGQIRMVLEWQKGQ